jgi:L-lactate dehydrogenase complex protein LldG
VSDARAAILQRIRAGLADVPGDEKPAWEPSPAPSPGVGDVERFVERAADYRAEVGRVAADAVEISRALADACARHAARRLVAPDGLPPEWTPAGVELLRDLGDAPLDVAALSAADGVITTCALAIAETGTIVLDAGSGQGRRVLTLVPDLHLCVVPADRVVGGVADAVARLQRPPALAQPPVTFISGPSATSDIELNRVEGVHGPRRLVIVVAG